MPKHNCGYGCTSPNPLCDACDEVKSNIYLPDKPSPEMTREQWFGEEKKDDRGWGVGK